MSEKRVSGVQQFVSKWDGKNGCLDFDGVRADVLNALARLSTKLDAQNFDLSGLRPGIFTIGETRSIFTKEITEDSDLLQYILIGEDCVRSVQFLSLAIFQQCLVNHFALCYFI